MPSPWRWVAQHGPCWAKEPPRWCPNEGKRFGGRQFTESSPIMCLWLANELERSSQQADGAGGQWCSRSGWRQNPKKCFEGGGNMMYLNGGKKHSASEGTKCKLTKRGICSYPVTGTARDRIHCPRHTVVAVPATPRHSVGLTCTEIWSITKLWTVNKPLKTEESQSQNVLYLGIWQDLFACNYVGACVLMISSFKDGEERWPIAVTGG